MNELNNKIEDVLGRNTVLADPSLVQAIQALITEQVRLGRIECMQYAKDLCTVNFDKTGFDLAVTFGTRIKELKDTTKEDV